MLHFKTLLLLLWSLKSYGEACQIKICVTNDGNQTGCQQLGVNEFNIITSLAEIPNHTAMCSDLIRVYLTRGTHILSSKLEFNSAVKSLQIKGILHSTIQCSTLGGIVFRGVKNGNLSITDVTFNNCGINQKISGNTDTQPSVALYFDNIIYTLDNVLVANTKGKGLYTHRCKEQVMINCTFDSSSNGHAYITFKGYRKNSEVIVNISKTTFYNGSSINNSGGLEIYTTGEHIEMAVYISQCKFKSNEGFLGSHLKVFMKHPHIVKNQPRTDRSSAFISISNSVFEEGRGPQKAVNITVTEKEENFNVTIKNSSFTGNRNGAVLISQANLATIDNCTVRDNTGTGIEIHKLLYPFDEFQTVISDTNFATNFALNSRALYLNLTWSDDKLDQLILISNCSFYHHETEDVVKIEGTGILNKNRVVIEKSRFEKNRKIYGNCSCLHAEDVNITLDSTIFTDNNCTGVKLTASSILVENWLNMTRNRALSGGAIQMFSKEVIESSSKLYKSSTITLGKNSHLNIVNNSALLYGGGIYNDDKCEIENTANESCFFQFEDRSALLKFSGNSAELGGDAIFGGCQTECNIQTCSDRFNDRVKVEDTKSWSTFAVPPNRIVFCDQNTRTMCSTDHYLSVYMGQLFNVSVMIVDEFCVPSVRFFRAKLDQESTKIAHLGGLNREESYERSKKYCKNYPYSIQQSSKTGQSNVTMELYIHSESLSLPEPAMLTVHLKDCPKGFKFDEWKKECVCCDLLESLGVKCFPSTASLGVPQSTWLGEVKGEVKGQEAVNKYCQYCHKEGVEMITNFSHTDSLCTRNRTGVLCGACAPGLSLQLGSYKCANCSNSEYKGVLLIVVFMVVGIGLVILLLGLNLTVSTGVINGLIFYCNVIHSHGDSLLPMTHHTNQTHLNNAIKFLSTFQSWMNLDFGIVTCFFNNYNTYTSNWMQFVFPLYICLLILIIVMASRHSSRVSKLTRSNTVPVLATLLLLSYSKLLTTSIEGASYTEIQFLDKNTGNYKVWVMDGNVRYLKGKHIPLFLMSIITVVAILPFTLLILLGPLLQARSHHRPLHWINKMKPFLDAFYGPYTSRYRYWPGILLLVRMIILGSFAFYSLGDSHFKLLMISVMILVLFVIWITLGRSYTLSLYQSKGLNFLEMFFLLNLGVFAVGSIYTRYTKSQVVYQQILALLMVGSVFITFCGIILCQIFTMSSISKAIRRRIAHLIPKRITERATASEADKTTSYNRRLDNVEESSDNVGGATQTTVEMGDIDRPSCELREPLLDD